jgi:phosphoglycerate dehydrogenase-like enzyme
MINTLLTADFDPEEKKKLGKTLKISEAGFAVSNNLHDLLSEDELIEALKGVELFIVSYERVTPRVIREAKDLSLIASIRGGPEDNIDVAAAAEAGLPILRTVGRTQRPVAEHTLLMMLALARPLVRATNIIRNDQWSPAAMATSEGVDRMNRLYDDTTELYGKTLGIVGVGNIGEKVAQLARGIEMRVIAFDPYMKPEKAAALGVELTDYETLLRTSDYVSMHARVSPETKRMFGEKQFRLMKPTACFINTARGVLVDTDGLVKALKENWIRAAAIDAFDREPLSADYPLFSIPADKLLLTPHLAGFSQERVPYHSRYLVAGIENYLAGREPEGIFDPSVFKKPGFASRGGRLFGRKGVAQ